jgi:hypothetical protein
MPNFDCRRKRIENSFGDMDMTYILKADETNGLNREAKREKQRIM